jgi:hypothetical protein
VVVAKKPEVHWSELLVDLSAAASDWMQVHQDLGQEELHYHHLLQSQKLYGQVGLAVDPKSCLNHPNDFQMQPESQRYSEFLFEKGAGVEEVEQDFHHQIGDCPGSFLHHLKEKED